MVLSESFVSNDIPSSREQKREHIRAYKASLLLNTIKKSFNGKFTPSPYNDGSDDVDNDASEGKEMDGEKNKLIEQSTLDRILKIEVSIDTSLKFVGAIITVIGIIIAFMSGTLFWGLNSMKQDNNQIKQETKQSVDAALLLIDTKNNAILTEIKKDNEIARKDAEISRAKEEQFKSEIKAILLEKNDKK